MAAVRAYNFRVDPYAPATVWCTTRTAGTHTGAGLGSGRCVHGVLLLFSFIRVWRVVWHAHGRDVLFGPCIAS